MAFYDRPARLVGLAIGAVATSVPFAIGHQESVDEGIVLTRLKGIAMCLILPGVLGSTMRTNTHNPNLLVAALCTLLFSSLVGVIAAAFIRTYRNDTR
jgi:hypothetical protein